VTVMLETARRESEARVTAELRRVDQGLATLRDKIEQVETLLVTAEASRGGSSISTRPDALTNILSQIEQRWEQEILAVKRELHQTILAHNHNADLMADHKTAIDKIRAEIDTRGPFVQPRGPEFEVRLQEQLAQLAGTLEQSKVADQELDLFMHRGEALFQQLATLGVVVQSATTPPTAVTSLHPAAPAQLWAAHGMPPTAVAAAAAAALQAGPSYGPGACLGAAATYNPSLAHLVL